MVVSATTPAAGADWSLTVPAGHLYELLTVWAKLTTDANAANRSVVLGVSDGDATFLQLPPPALQTASLAYDYAWAQHGADHGGAPGQAIGLPRLVLEPGWVLSVTTANVQVGDQWSQPKLLVLDTLVAHGRVQVGELAELLVEVVAGPGS